MITDPHSYAESFISEDEVKRDARARGEEIGVTDATSGTGAYLKHLAHSLSAQSVVEIGTGSGVGALWVLEGMLASGTLTSIDDEMEHSNIAKIAFQDAQIAPARFRLITNPVMDVMTKLADRAYDLVIFRHNPEDLPFAITEAHRFDPKAMVENAVIGREIECAVLEIDGQPRASIVGQIEIDPKFDFYDFEAKYLDGATSITLPAPIAEALTKEIQRKAVEAFISLGCSGLARVDFFLTPNNEVIINELNTMPGFTATSVFPKMWAASGVSYTEVITHLLKSALTRNNGVLGN